MLEEQDGVRIRIAALISPFASSGVDGHTHFSPGMCANEDSGFWEWTGGQSPPDGRRSVIGTGVPTRQCCLAAIVTRWSQAQETKSANCISATGRRPIRAAPVAPATIAVSESGASITRQSPNSSCSPCVTLKAPPKVPMSSPITNTRSSWRISWRRPSVIACRYVRSLIAQPWCGRSSSSGSA